MKGRNLKGARATSVESSCHLWNDCFTCPFPDCKIGKKYVVMTLKARTKARELGKKGKTPKQIAKELGKSIRTIKRWLKEEENVETGP